MVLPPCSAIAELVAGVDSPKADAGPAVVVSSFDIMFGVVLALPLKIRPRCAEL